jgi:hypothetical protein
MAPRLAIVISLLGLGCGPKDNARTGHQPASQPPSASLPQTQVDTVFIAGPTVIAAFPVTQAAADSSENTNEALADFQFHLGNARRVLRAQGIAVIERYDSLVLIRMDSGGWVWRVRADSGGVGYLLLAPRKPPEAFWGVMTDSDLIDAVVHYLEKR